MTRSAPPRVAVVHTSFGVVSDLTALFGELGPEVRLRHIVDDSVLRELIADGDVSSAVRDRLLGCFRVAEEAGCDVILSQCSSVGEIAEIASRTAVVPIVRMDAPMAQRATDTGGRIGVVATLETTLGPTRRLIESTARSRAVDIQVVSCLVEGAFERLADGDREAHDRRVIEAIRRTGEQVDVVVCAQGSMASAAERAQQAVDVPVLTSPRMGVKSAVDRARAAAANRS
jgi:Asp/Glu/hydantoin racemase